ncbi:hypothetical protein RSAG8_07233, partial [Rhizoctonia solani AG-8 WAC10335]
MTTQLDTPASLPPLEQLLKQSGKRTASIFYAENGEVEEEKSARVRLAVKIRDEYLDVQTLPSALLAREGIVGPARPGAVGPKAIAGPQQKLITAGPSSDGATAPSKLYDVDIAKINTLIRPDGRKKAYVRLTPDHEALDVANKIGFI